MTARPLLAAAWLAAAGGCVLLDDRELEVRPEGVLFAGQDGPRVGADYALELDTRTSAARVEVFLDGASLGTYRANRPFQLSFAIVPQLGGPSWGEHRLVVREIGTPRPKEVARTFVFYPFLPGFVVSPPLEGAPLDTTTVELRFARPPLRERVTPENVWLEADGQRVAVAPRLLDGGATVAFDLPAPLRDHAEVAVALSWYRLFGASTPGEARLRWPGARVDAAIGYGGLGTLVAGDVPLQLGWAGRFPPAVQLLAGDRLIATLGPTPPTVPFVWDTRLVPDGVYPLTLRAEGFLFRFATPPPSLTVANEPPRVVSCTPVAGVPTGFVADRCFDVVLDRPGALARATLTLAGKSYSGEVLEGRVCSAIARGLGSGWSPLEPPEFEAPALDGAAVLSVTARNGAFVEGVSACEVPWPAWSAPLLDPLPGPAAASSVALQRSFGSCAVFGVPCVFDAILLATSRDAPEAGKVRAWGQGSAGWTSSAILNRTDGSALELAGDSWIESQGPGSGRVCTADSCRPDDPGAASLARSFGDTRTYTHDALAWSEPRAAGKVVLVNGSELPRSDTDAVASEPAVMSPEILFGGEPYFGTLAAWTERAPGGVARLRAAKVSSAQSIAVEGVDNADPAVDAASPTVFAANGIAVVAWLEGGQVLARVITEAGVGPARVLNADPAHAARSPRFDGNGRTPTLYWLEADGAGADAIRVRRYTGTDWLLYPRAVNGPSPGDVASFSVDSHRVAWVDGAGKVHLRVAGFPR